MLSILEHSDGPVNYKPLLLGIGKTKPLATLG